MTIIIETERLIIREFNLGDTKAVLEFNSEEVNRYTGDAGMCNNIEDAKNIIQDIWLAEYQKYGFARWAVELKATNQVIGFCGFKNDSRINAVDIGYRLHPDFWGKGYATEANLACIEYAKKHMDLDIIYGEVVNLNLGSVNIIEKLGMSFIREYQEDDFTLLRYALSLKGNPLPTE
ncbi:GNAT family N-acetyltransferase [Shewanella sp. 1_MG-2023]|uniref:GNAT family N-acetyltransferase n=2 Tax=unclassified Shewanella TaxID=196818 RepID=UPI000CBB8A0D|nr:MULTISPECIES: GNAT family N-acetyltransferase [unclassified Shewanella]MDO6610707.1 GNAT family N-acetyltransferase [Shewanella sp. 7_MG-2023]MDO6770832.1 GNAT family N-acetyltransferase [Shewanella sp. 2_MG-2023]MDO6793150.1 GNAT family N-acetyltransferase [Shewanella sp. 1_MG-2023]PMG77359.1 GNAT family N-acetyltransferase [Shewanella sp. 10N.286.51.B7]